MENNQGIPCAACQLWHPEKKGFSCEPNKCEKLTEWLLNHKEIEAKTTSYIV